MTNIAIIVGSTRPERKSQSVAQWVYHIAQQRLDATFEIVDLAEHRLPFFDEPLPPSRGRYTHTHTKAWAATIKQFDGFVFVTPEYNRSSPAVLKNAFDLLYKEWNDKAAAFVGYGVTGGSRAIESLHLVASSLKLAVVSNQVMLSLFTDFQDMQTLAPADHQAQVLTAMLDDLVKWSTALAPLRAADTQRS